MPDFATSAEASNIARVAKSEAEFDPEFSWFHQASLGAPVLVRNVQGEPAYWLVPIHRDQAVGGFVRVMPDGTVAAIGQFAGRTPSALPPVVTGIDAAGAADRARQRLRKSETASEPMFVHDGPPGREAWLVTTQVDSQPARWIFVTSGFIYERSAHEPLNTELF